MDTFNLKGSSSSSFNYQNHPPGSISLRIGQRFSFSKKWCSEYLGQILNWSEISFFWSYWDVHTCGTPECALRHKSSNSRLVDQINEHIWHSWLLFFMVSMFLDQVCEYHEAPWEQQGHRHQSPCTTFNISVTLRFISSMGPRYPKWDPDKNLNPLPHSSGSTKLMPRHTRHKKKISIFVWKKRSSICCCLLHALPYLLYVEIHFWL